ncbi:ARF/SAR type [Hexamita inflata]|uniref:ARF/SAR type n=1 Tax=Hexamita inflata TaxID=28002 RepID=A0AA86P6X8_9EUKA|nr:ARF/SAR type [Hexamita inflata]
MPCLIMYLQNEIQLQQEFHFAKPNLIYRRTQNFSKNLRHILYLQLTNIQPELRKQLDQIIKMMSQQNSKLLLYLTKIDLQASKTNEEIIDELNLDNLKTQIVLQRCNALTGDGIQQGLNLLKKK